MFEQFPEKTPNHKTTEFLLPKQLGLCISGFRCSSYIISYRSDESPRDESCH